MSAVPQEIYERMAANDRINASKASANLMVHMIKSQSPFAITPEWFADVAAALSSAAEYMPDKEKEIAQNYLDDLHDDMRDYG